MSNDSVINPWRTLSSKEIYSNPWIKVREDEVIRPDGNPGIYGVVETKIAVGVVAVTDINEIVLVGQYRYPTQMYSWEIIEGGAEKGEEPRATALRELKEEAGVIPETLELIAEGIQLSNCFSNEIGVVYLAKGLKFVEASPDGDECIVSKKEQIDTVKAMVSKGEIVDALSLIGLYRYFEMI